MKTRRDSLEVTKSIIKASGKGMNNTASGQGSHDNQTPPKAADADATWTKRRKFTALMEDSDEDDVTSPTRTRKLQQVCFLRTFFAKL